jgi:hypothetical protein
MSDDIATRVRYYERQFLRTQDFTDEQAYHLTMRRRHNIAHHRWGIVYGLEVKVDPDGRPVVQPGMAIDGYGRELIVPDVRLIDEQAFNVKDSDELDVSLAYRQIVAGEAPGARGCGDETQADRVQEYPQIRYDVPDPSFADPRMPRGVPPGDRAFDPSRTPPADGDWPVVLGRIKRSRASADKPPTYTVVPVERPYAGLVGETIRAPSKRARVQIGAEQPDDPRRFAVFVQDPGNPDASIAPALEIDADGAIDLRGEATLYGDLTIAGGTLEFGVGPARARQARPWQIYHHLETLPATSAPRAGTAPAGQEQEELHELRIEMLSAGVDQQKAGNNKVVIGAWSEEDKAFKPCLTIADDCTITVHGDLIVEGQLKETQKRPDAQLTQSVRALALANAIGTLSGATIGQLAVGPERELSIAERLIDTDIGKRAVVGIIESDRDRGQQFARFLLRSPDARKFVVDQQVTDSTARAAVVTELLGRTKGRTAIVDELRVKDDARAAIFQDLIKEGDSGLKTLAETLARPANLQAGRPARLIQLIRALPAPEALLNALKQAIENPLPERPAPSADNT